jgi:hypothetical protein
MINTLVPQLGGVIAQRRESLWATVEFIADQTDTAYGCVIGGKYTLWIAQKDGKTQKGSDVTKGDWFVVANK